MAKKKRAGDDGKLGMPAFILKSDKLPIQGETHFRRKYNVALLESDRHGGIFIDRVYAKGGFVITEYTDTKAGEQKAMLLTPTDACDRALSMSKVPPEMRNADLIQAIINAAAAAKSQTLTGGNPLFELNKDNLNVDKLVQEFTLEVQEARKTDPELDEEMTKIEREYALRGGR